MKGVKHMIKFTSIKIDSGSYSFKYAKETESGNTEFYSLESKDSPRPEFISALLELKTLLLEKFSLFKFNANFIRVYAVKLKYGGKEYPEDCISSYKLIGGAVNKNSDFCKIETQMIKVCLDKQDIANDILNRLSKEAELYITGKRAQASLFEAEEEKTNSDDKVVYMMPSNNSQQGVTQ